jgi:hypothetical protein
MSDGATMSAPAAAWDTADAAVAVIGVLAEADVGHHEHVVHLALDRANRRLHRRFRIVRERADVVLGVREAEQDHALHAVVLCCAHFVHRLVDREVEDARHRRHFTADAVAFADEQRQHEHVGRQPGFAHERPHRRRTAEPAKTARQRERRMGVDSGHDGLR